MGIDKPEKSDNYSQKILDTASRRDNVTEKLAKELISVPAGNFVIEAYKLFKIEEPTMDASLAPAILKLQEMLKFPKRDNKNGQDGILGAITIAALIRHFPELQKYSLLVRQRNSLSSAVSKGVVYKRKPDSDKKMDAGVLPAPKVKTDVPAAPAEPARKTVEKHEKVVSANQVILVGDSLTVGYRGDVFIAGKRIPTSSDGKYVKGGKSIMAMNNDLQKQLSSGELDNVLSVAILGGANNVAIHSSEKIIGVLKNMIKILTSKKPSAHVVLITLPPMLGYNGFVHKDVIRKRTAEINDWIRAQAQANPKQISCVDLYSMIDDPKRPGYTKKGLTSDGLHLSGDGYKLLADAVRKAIG